MKSTTVCISINWMWLGFHATLMGVAMIPFLIMAWQQRSSRRQGRLEVTVLATQDFLSATQAQYKRRLSATWSERGRAKSSPMLSLGRNSFSHV